MNRLSQDARRRQAVVKKALSKGKSKASELYGVSLSSVKRWCKRYDGTWQSLLERSHRPKSHPAQHTTAEEKAIREAFSKKYFRYGWDGVYDELIKNYGYTRSYSGMYHAGKRLGMGGEVKKKKPPRVSQRRYPEVLVPGEKVQIDVKEAPYCCLKGKARRDGKRLYQWTAIDECTRLRFVYAYEDHTPENSIDFWDRLKNAFPFPIKSVQTDNGTEFTYRFISDNTLCPFEKTLAAQSVKHILIPPRTPWKNGKVERSHRNDQRYFYNHECFSDVGELNLKLKTHLIWSNNKSMRVLGRISPNQRLAQFLGQII
ncbi:MAG: DDE-type integrase/transposase/recombinase [Defluviitaleaceae bacterium]|nr:DDE-type integrase/transposase/recombinase [Defluviitaleaceae bacterium]